jgi:hypothetical protein
MVRICIESGVGAHVDDATLAWAYDLRWWGLCGQGIDEASAVDDLLGRAFRDYAGFLSRHGEGATPLDGVDVVERVHGDEQAFALDRAMASDEERDRTCTILRWSRSELEELLAGCDDAELDWDDPSRELPDWASWRTLRQMSWHIADVESRYYLASLGVAPPERAERLDDELRRSHRHVLESLAVVERDVVREPESEVWTYRKVLRRLAWHERSELDAMRALLVRARAAD